MKVGDEVGLDGFDAVGLFLGEDGESPASLGPIDGKNGLADLFQGGFDLRGGGGSQAAEQGGFPKNLHLADPPTF